MLPRMAGLAVKPPATAPTTIRPDDVMFNKRFSFLKYFVDLLVTPILEMIIFIQFFDLLYFLFCFTFVNMIKAKYIFLLTHYIIGLDKLQNKRTVQFFLHQYCMKFVRIQVIKVWRIHNSIDCCIF